VLNRYGRPQLYARDYTGFSRREMLGWIEHFAGAEDEVSRQEARAMRDAPEFFDRVGRLTPLRARDENARRQG
jgi:hypothetical protein